MITPRRTSLAAVLVAATLLLGACGNGDDSSSSEATSGSTTTTAGTAESTSEGNDPTEQPAVVASTSWVAAFAKAAGIEDVTIVAPVDLQHPPDYDPKPSDLAAITDADYVLLAGFEGFADRMTEASGSDAEVITLEVDNDPDTIRANVRSLAETFDTQDAAEAWIEDFDQRVDELGADLEGARPAEASTAVAHVFMAYWANLAGIEVVGTYGPQPVTAAQLAEFTAAQPDLVLTNAHVPAGAVFDDLEAEQIAIRNFPDDSLDLIEVFEANTASILAAFEAS